MLGLKLIHVCKRGPRQQAVSWINVVSVDVAIRRRKPSALPILKLDDLNVRQW